MPGTPVVLETLGGLVVTSRPEDIPEGASPRTYDTDFIIGRVIQRPGEQSVFSYNTTFGPLPASIATDFTSSVTPWANPENVLADDSAFATVSLGSVTLDIQGTEGLSYTDPTTTQTLIYTLVTFVENVPAIGSTYTFSGLTTNTFLNGKVLISCEAPYGINGGIVLNANQALFPWGTVFAEASDTGSAAVVHSGYISDQIRVTGFGFSLPSSSAVTGITVTVKGFSPSATLYGQLLQNGVPLGEIKSIALPVSLGAVILGSDTWEGLWGFADINSSSFGVAVWVKSTAPNNVSLGFISITVGGSPSQLSFLGMTSAEIDQSDEISLHLDSQGQTWEEDIPGDPNVLSLQPLIPLVPPGSYMKGVRVNDASYMAYSDLTQGLAPPQQYNGQWADRITQVGPGAPPQFTASTDAGSQASVTAYSASGGIITLTAANSFSAGLLVSMSGFTAGLVPLNGQTFSVLGTGLSGTQFQISSSLVTGSGSDTGKATPQFTYPIVASPNGIVQPAQMSDPDDPGHVNTLLWSAGPGSKTAGNTITVYYSNSFTHSTPDQTLVGAFNSGNPVYVYIASQPFGNGTWQVTSIGNAIPPGGAYYRWYFTYQVPTSNFQQYGGPDDARGTYQVTQATLTTTTAVPGLATGNLVSLANVTNASWDGTYTIVAALNSGSYSISQSQLTNGTATYTWALVSGAAPTVGELVTITGTLNANGSLNVVDAVIASVTGSVSGTFTVNGFSTVQDFPVAVESGQATTAGTKFIIDPGAALNGNTSQSPIIGNSGGGTLTVVGSGGGGTFPIDAGTYQGTVFFITRNGAVTAPAPPSTFTVAVGANYITASNIPIGPPNVVARGIAFTEPGANGIPGANFYTYDTAVSFSVGGTKYTASALIVPDNSTTTMKFTFSTSVLLSSDEIDIPGNNYFNLIEIGDPVWIYQYAGRMLYGLCRTKVQNFLNMSFDGGYLPNNNGLSYPLGWNTPASSQVQPTFNITGWSITANVVTFNASNWMIAGDQVLITGLGAGSFMNGLVLTVIAASNTTFSAAFTHADVGPTADTGVAGLVNQQVGLVPSPVFGDVFQYLNQSRNIVADSVVLFQNAYQDSYGVAILQPNTAYSVRLTARALNANAQTITFALFTFANGAFGNVTYGSCSFTVNQGNFVTQIQPLTTGISTIPIALVFAVVAGHVTQGAGFQIDRIEVFPTERPVDTTTIWTSYVGNFEAVDGVTGSLGVGVDNPQAAQGAYQILEQLYIEKTNSLSVTQDSPNYEPNQWTVHQASDKAGSVGPNAFDEGEEFSLSISRNGGYYFDGGKKMPFTRELQSTGFQSSLWETLNWNAKQTMWLRNDFKNRRILMGVPMITPNFWLPFAPQATPISPNVILMCNYTGCPTGEELSDSSEVHVTMFGDMKALDMRRKWSIWQIVCPIAEFIPRVSGDSELLLANGLNTGKIYQLVNGSPSGEQNTDDGQQINWLYTTYGFLKAKQGQQLGMTALRKVANYFIATMEGMGQVACRILINTLGAISQNVFQIRPNFTLTYPAQNDQESNLEVAGQRLFVEFSSASQGGYAEIGPVTLDIEADVHSPHRGIRS